MRGERTSPPTVHQFDADQAVHGRPDEVGVGRRVGARAGQGSSDPAAPGQESIDREPETRDGEEDARDQRGSCGLRGHGPALSMTRENIAKLLKKSAFFLDAFVVKKGQYAIAS